MKLTQLIEKHILKIILIVAMSLILAYMQNTGIRLQVEKKHLQNQIEILKARHIQIASELMQITLQGELEKKLKQKGSKLTTKHSIPKIIYTKQ